MSDQRRRSQSYPIIGATKPRSNEPLHEQLIDSKIDASRVPWLKIDGKIVPDNESYMSVLRIGRMLTEDYANMGEYVASLMGEFEMASSCRIHIIPHNSFQGSRSSELEHWLSVLRVWDGFKAYESGDAPVEINDTRKALLRESFYGRKPILVDYGLGTKLVFENLDMNDRRCTVYPLGEAETGGKSLALMPFYYRDKVKPSGIVEFEGDLVCVGSRISGLQKSVLTANATMLAASQISYALTHKLDAITVLSKVVDYERDFKQGIRQLAQNKIKSLHHIMMDVDNFKKFNDDHGHDVGDMVLRSVAETIKDSIRSNDVAYRVGGE
ncbi:MAG: GGDEF domain-containing protein, partial [Nitrososphaera sp.]|nr:GGDEF domain-containing protein [Nitrososphaera sp.]